MSLTFDAEFLSPEERQTLHALLAGARRSPLALEDLWALMDAAWDEGGCDNRRYDSVRAEAFYRHPVWLLNGLFAESDPISLEHRRAMTRAVALEGPSSVLDYGGGFGTLGRLIARELPGTTVDIFEPHPPPAALALSRDIENLRYVSAPKGPYDCATLVDVLEHVPDPLGVLSEVASRVRHGGLLVIANCFHPVTKCHLPDTFHLRFSFRFFARLLGLEHLGQCDGTYAHRYRKRGKAPAPWRTLRCLEAVSRHAHRALSPLFGLARRRDLA